MGKLFKCFVLCLVLWGNFATGAIAAPTETDVMHLLNRTSFGPTPGEVQQIQRLGLDRYLQQQLNPESLPEPKSLTRRLAQLNTLELSTTQLNQAFHPSAPQGDSRRPKPNPAFARSVLQEATQARLLRSTQSPRQLQEVMVDFWFNHFNVHSGKGRTRIWLAAYEREAIRPNALGTFRDLLGATAQHPAMLFYLDNWLNTAPNSPGAKGQFKGLNENYARELMELHSLGLGGGYSQADVESLARIFTGWSLQLNAKADPQTSSFHFVPQRHDFGDKRFLGQIIPGRGEDEVRQALDLLARHPSTARHISYKLAQYFVADQPPDSLVDRLSQRFLATDGDISELLNLLFHSDAFWAAPYRNAKFKTPYQYLISILRLTDRFPERSNLLTNLLQKSGMPLYGCLTPDGYQNTQAAWLSPDGLSRRLDFAIAFTRQQKLQDQSAQLLANLGDHLSPQSRTVIKTAPQGLRSALILGSPELMWR